MTQHIHILSHPRSGSTYLFYALREFINPYQPHYASDRFSCYEPFSTSHIQENGYKQTIINDRIESYRTSPDPFVIMNHRWQLEELERINFNAWTQFCNLDLHTILLLRRNLFDMALSLCISQITNQYKFYTPITEPILIDYSIMEKTVFECSQSVDQTVSMAIKFNSKETVFYEDLTFEPKIDYSNRKICHTHPTILPDKTVTQYVTKAPSKKQMIKNYHKLEALAKRVLGQSTFNHLVVENYCITEIKE